jgi:capsular polysaccharide biosynthesis protein
MEFGQFILILKKRKKVIFFAVLLFLAIAAVITFRSPLDYRASARILIVQNYGTNTPPDPYVVAQANKYLTGVLTQVVSSNAFYERTLASGFDFDKTYFSGDLAHVLNQWHSSVEAFAAEDTGIIEIRTYRSDKFQAEQLAQAVVYTLKENHALYHSSGEKVTLKVIDQPLVSNYPVRPDLLLTFGSALLIGFAFGLFYIYIFSYPRELYLPQNQAYQNQATVKNLQPIEPFEPEPVYSAPAARFAQAPVERSDRGQPAYQEESPRVSQARPEFLPQEETAQPGRNQAIGRGDMRNVFGHKGL